MSVTILMKNNRYEVIPGICLEEALHSIGMEVESVLALRDGKLISAETILADGEVVKLVTVIVGG